MRTMLQEWRTEIIKELLKEWGSRGGGSVRSSSPYLYIILYVSCFYVLPSQLENFIGIIKENLERKKIVK